MQSDNSKNVYFFPKSQEITFIFHNLKRNYIFKRWGKRPKALSRFFPLKSSSFSMLKDGKLDLNRGDRGEGGIIKDSLIKKPC